MSIRAKIIISLLVLTIPVIIIGLVSLVQLDKVLKPVNQDIPKAADLVEKTTYKNRLAMLIRYYDEVLTQSARNYAFTGQKEWKKRYDDFVPVLDKTIKEAIISGDNEDRQIFSDIDASNLTLVDMETKAISSVDKGDKLSAQQILDSDEYLKQKEIYKSGLVKFDEKQGQSFSQALSDSTKVLKGSAIHVGSLINVSRMIIILIGVIALLLAIVLGVIISYLIIKPLNLLKKTAQEIALGNLDKQIEINSKDEIGELAKTFNEMTNKLKESRVNIEERVNERTAQLEKLNKVMVGRELSMIEMKKKIADIEKLINKSNV